MKTSNSKPLPGNIFGGARAEIDKDMLEKAFIRTPDFEALAHTNDFNFVVGRRGTGKSALSIKVSEFLEEHKTRYVYCNAPSEYESLEIQASLNRIASDYRIIRAITRVAWRTSILNDLADQILDHHKLIKSEINDYLGRYLDEQEHLAELDCFKKTNEMIKNFSGKCESADELPGLIANSCQLERLTKSVAEALSTLGKTAYYFFDGLDEGWTPSQSATAVLGGLAACAADFAEKQTGIHLFLFIRDNIFRSLSYFDKDFSRHIEGTTLRLNWDEGALLHMIADRLRVAFDMKGLENDTKVWNRFAHSGLKNREGFHSCLSYTLYRPRDLIVLLNTAYVQAARSGRQDLVKEDIEISSKQISKERLSDLLKEYDQVFPGLPLLVETFGGKPAFRQYIDVSQDLNHEIANNGFEDERASDFAMLGSGKEAFFALYSVGFVGIENPSTKKLQFCHDGSSADIDATKAEQQTCVHPCYWKALDIQSELIEEDILIEVYDDQRPPQETQMADFRTKLVGQLTTQLPKMAEGKDAASRFEDWVLRAIQILFPGQLTNPSLKPNSDALQRRDIVATNMAQEGFWHRVREDYRSQQVVIEVKNYSSLKPDDFRQAISYAGNAYGSFVMVVNRNQNEGLPNTERDWVKEMWDQHKILVFVLPAPILSRYIGKLRSRHKFDYADEQLNKRLDTFLRSYLSLKHVRKPKRRKPK